VRSSDAQVGCRRASTWSAGASTRRSELAAVPDPDEYRIELIDQGRLASQLHWALVTDERADMAVIVEEIGVGDAIALHRHRIDEG
jgi:hypothetical protein